MDLPLDDTTITHEDRQHFPKNGWTPFFNKYTQNNIIEKSSKTRLQIMGEPLVEGGKSDYGLRLNDLAALLEAHDLSVTMVHINDAVNTETVKAALIRSLDDKKDYAIANYSREPLGQPGGGHFSPIAAFHKNSDSFLVLDVTNTKAAWVWVDSDTLFEAMATRDGEKNRGYLLARESSHKV